MSTQRSYALSELVDLTGFDRRTIVYYIQSGLLPKVGRRGPHTRYPDECLSRLLFIKGIRELHAGGQLLTATLAEIGRALSVLDAQGIRDILDRGLPSAEIEQLFAEKPAAGQAALAPAGARITDTADTLAVSVAVPVTSPAVGSAAGLVDPATQPSFSGTSAGGASPGGDRRSYGLADASIRQRFGSERTSTLPTTPLHEDTHPRLPALQMDATGSPSSQPPHIAGSDTSGTALPAAASGDDHAELGHLLRELELRPTLNPKRSPPGAPEQWTEIPITSRVYLSIRGLPEEDAVIAESLARLLKRALRARPTAA